MLTVRLVRFEQPKSIEHMSQTELIAHVGRLKTAANARWASGDKESACGEYDRAQRLLRLAARPQRVALPYVCLLYTSDAADE